MEDTNHKEFEILKASVDYADNYFEMHNTNHFQALRQGFQAGARWASEEKLSEEFTMEDMINYGVWLQKNDTEVHAAEWFGYTNQDMLKEWKTKHKKKEW